MIQFASKTRDPGSSEREKKREREKEGGGEGGGLNTEKLHYFKGDVMNCVIPSVACRGHCPYWFVKEKKTMRLLM